MKFISLSSVIYRVHKVLMLHQKAKKNLIMKNIYKEALDVLMVVEVCIVALCDCFGPTIRSMCIF